MKLNEFIEQLIDIRDKNYRAGEMEVLYRHGASGDTGPLSTPHITDEVDDQTGPFDTDGKDYISIYAGN